MLTYNSTISVYSMHKHSKEVLNTIGNGWRQSKDFSQTKYQIQPIQLKTNQITESIVPASGIDSPCVTLLLASDEDYTNRFETEFIVSLPQILTENSDGILNVRLPFKRKQNFNFNSKASAFVLLKYYVTVKKCYEYRKQASDRFDLRFFNLVKEKLLPFLQRDDFYPGFGAILRILESLNQKGVVSNKNIETEPENIGKNLKNNRSVPDDMLNDVEADNCKNKQNERSFVEQVIHFVSMEVDDTDERKKIEIIFFILVAIVLSLAFIILCCCLFMKRRQKNEKNNLEENKSKEKTDCFKSFCNRFKSNKTDTEKSSVSESNIGPKSSSILLGNDFDDTGMIVVCNIP